MSKSKCVHYWKIDDEGNGICKKCGLREKHATPRTVDSFVSKSQVSNGINEINHYKQQQQSYEVY